MCNHFSSLPCVLSARPSHSPLFSITNLSCENRKLRSCLLDITYISHSLVSSPSAPSNLLSSLFPYGERQSFTPRHPQVLSFTHNFDNRDNACTLPEHRFPLSSSFPATETKQTHRYDNVQTSNSQYEVEAFAPNTLNHIQLNATRV
jgi:hypothetical protein